MEENMTPTQWLEALQEAAGQPESQRPAPVIGHTAVRTRGSVGPEKPTALSQLIGRLRQQVVSVRLEVIQELLRAGDERAIIVLRLLAVENPDPDVTVRWAIVDGLRRVERVDAVSLLEQIARNDPDETIRSKAIGLLGERALAAYRAQAGPEEATPKALVRSRGAVRTRGTSPVRRASPEAQEILDALYDLRDSEKSEYVKGMADLTLRQLGE